jgi:hypothetical protein
MKTIEEMTMDELKVFAFDQIKIRDILIANLQAVLKAIEEKEKEEKKN